MFHPLFPKYLNQGSNGPAVFVLQMFLIGGDFDTNDLIPDGDYGEQTALSVMNLQLFLGVEIDGHFGPATREAVQLKFGRNFNMIPASVVVGETIAVGPMNPS